MKQAYLFYNDSPLDFPLDESIHIVDNLNLSSEYLISNCKSKHSLIYAPEINMYIDNTKDDISNKITNIKKLYDIRLEKYDSSLDLDYSQEVGKKLFIISDNKLEIDSIISKLNENEFDLFIFKPTDILDVDGHIGNLKITIKKNEDNISLQTDQMIWFDAPYFATKQNGVYDPNIEDIENILDTIKNNIPEYKYKNYIKYNPDICQYHERQTEICGKCADVCPTVAIMKIDEQKHLEFSNIDCHGCGGCVSVCPSGALDFTQMPRSLFSQIASFYEDTVALVIPEQLINDNFHPSLEKNILPLAIEGRKFLDEVHFLILLQTSGKPIIFYTDFISKGTGDAITLINEIFQRKYNKKAIYVCMDEEELIDAQNNLEDLSECKFNHYDQDLDKREIFTYRLFHLVGDDDLGIIKTGEHIHYGNIKIKESNCTLCLACVGACNVKALTAHPEDNSLRFNPSLCTDCGYCEFICPEKDCLEVIYDEIELNKKYFIKNIMAKDELFKCVECGIEFATVKSIEKIASIMAPRFGDDKARIRALYCCADCKPKVTLQEYLNKQNEIK